MAFKFLYDPEERLNTDRSQNLKPLSLCWALLKLNMAKTTFNAVLINILDQQASPPYNEKSWLFPLLAKASVFCLR